MDGSGLEHASRRQANGQRTACRKPQAACGERRVKGRHDQSRSDRAIHQKPGKHAAEVAAEHLSCCIFPGLKRQGKSSETEARKDKGTAGRPHNETQERHMKTCFYANANDTLDHISDKLLLLHLPGHGLQIERFDGA